MNLYDIVRPGWNKGFVILIGLSGSALLATPPHHSSSHHTAHRDRDDSYITHVVTPAEERYGDSDADRERRRANNTSRWHADDADDADQDDCDDCDPD